MATYIVAARIDENGKARGGAAGDQTGKEVMKQALSGSGTWTRVLRPPSGAGTMVAQALAAAANDNIGYDQNQRETLYNAAKAANWQLANVGKCECDCSSLIAVLANCAGFKVNPSMYTGNEQAALTAVGFKDMAYSAGSLKVGDVLWRSGHTAIVVSTTNSAPQPQPAPAPSSPGLAVDGEWGPATTRALQKLLGTTVDGIVSGQRSAYRKNWPSCLTSSWRFGWSGKSPMIAALQRKLGISDDGIAGPATCKALQKRLGVAVDGVFGPNSVKALQKALNNGKL